MRDGPSIAERCAPRIGGVVPFTTIDFPGRLAAVLFMQGCPWRCRYCQNPHLVSQAAAAALQPWPDVLRWLASRRTLLDGVVFSGGEPTAQPAIGEAVDAVRTLGFDVALHTAGIYPRRLSTLLPSLSWVGLDIKAPTVGYEKVTAIAASGTPAFQSLDLVVASGIPFEVRTTVHPTLTPPATLRVLARELAAHGVTRWTLQPFRAAGCDDEQTVAAGRHVAIDAALVAALRQQVADIRVRD